jgi:hypothetical protein
MVGPYHFVIHRAKLIKLSPPLIFSMAFGDFSVGAGTK